MNDGSKINKWPFDNLSSEEQFSLWPKHLVRKGIFDDAETAEAMCQMAMLAGIPDIEGDSEMNAFIELQALAKSLDCFKGLVR